ncbi:MAG: hypothetical protein H7Y31_11505 [Chitinophagaceae bacterium]|nr:hypothetical protein [Chitinophagaceae bacterium]
MSVLKTKVDELFAQDQQLNALEKEIKVKKAHYHHLLLKNQEKSYTDDEVMMINTVHEEVTALESRRAGFRDQSNSIKQFLLSKLAPLGGGKWVHQTTDPIHPHWEFWVEDDELKYARLNGNNY